MWLTLSRLGHLNPSFALWWNTSKHWLMTKASLPLPLKSGSNLVAYSSTLTPFLRWNTACVLLEHSPTPGEMSEKGQVNSLEWLTCPLMFLWCANEISMIRTHFPFPVFCYLGHGTLQTSTVIMVNSVNKVEKYSWSKMNAVIGSAA